MLITFILLHLVVAVTRSFQSNRFSGFWTDDNSTPPLDNAYDVLYLPKIAQSSAIDYNFHAFGRTFTLNLLQNPHLTPQTFKINIIDRENSYVMDRTTKHCFYIHHDDTMVASFNLCDPNSMSAIIFTGNYTFEIYPLPNQPHVEAITVDGSTDDDPNVKIPHIIKRSVFNKPSVHDDVTRLETFTDPLNNQHFDRDGLEKRSLNSQAELNTAKLRGSKLTLELAVFFDEAAYKLFSTLMTTDEALVDMILACMNGVQALYHHPTIGVPIDIVLVRLDVMKRQPSAMPHFNGDRTPLLDSFCAYQHGLNVVDDGSPDHWDMALYISGLDFYAIENGRKSSVTMGLATVGGVCLGQYDCVIAEMGTTNVFGKPYPSAGFTSVYIIAHEMGHNLGMHHDGVGNACPKEGYIMSPSRGTTGETIWSYCSSDVLYKLGDYAKCLHDTPARPKYDHTIFEDTPGQKYGAKKQCEVLLRDRDAIVAPSQKLNQICYSLSCKTPHRSGFYFAGPALEGTTCGRNMWCHGGECVQMTKKPPKIVAGGWSPWTIGECRSGCIEASVGYQEKTRTCTNPRPVNSEECEGGTYEVTICKDHKVCKTRSSVTDYAASKCREFARFLKELDPSGGGLQAPHEELRPWMGCAIFCKKKDLAGFYTPRLELNDLGISPYFPDGTRCHHDTAGDYYCMQHHCLPEDFIFNRISPSVTADMDLSIAQNAHPHADHPVPTSWRSYFSVDANGKPLQTKLATGTFDAKEQDWEVADYVELPSFM